MHPSDMRMPAQFPAVARTVRRVLQTASIAGGATADYRVPVPTRNLVLLRAGLIRVGGTSSSVTVTAYDGNIFEAVDASSEQVGPLVTTSDGVRAMPRVVRTTTKRLLVQFENVDPINAGVWRLYLTLLPTG